MLVSLMAAWVSQSWALAPTENAGVEPNRILPFVVSEQLRLRAQPAWHQFLAGDGAGWTARFDPVTGLARRASGPPIVLPDVSDAKAVVRSLREVWTKNPSIIGVPLSSLRLDRASYHAPSDTWYVSWNQEIDGVPVWRAGLTARVRNGRLVMFGNEVVPDATRWTGSVSRLDAMDLAQLDGPAPLADHTELDARAVILPVPRGALYDLRPVWEVRSVTAAPLGRWVSFVDAETGEVLSWYNEINFFDGSVLGEHQSRTVGDPMVVSPMGFLNLSGDNGGTGITSADGSFNVGDGDWQAGFSGTYVTVRNAGGSAGRLDLDEGENLFTDNDASQPEINSYIFLNEVHAWAMPYASDVSWVSGRSPSNVNMDDVCNAYFDGRSVNFYVEGGGCANTGLIADVNYHEWGHGLHYYSLLSGTFDGSYSEGYSDTVAFLMTLDSTIAPGFITSNGSGIREVASDRVYPDDIQNEVHEDGLIYAGAMWDLLGLLQDRYGDAGTKGQGWEVVTRLTIDSVKAGPVLADTYDEVLLADDDNGDLSDGTPHACEIIEAFGRHGLGPGATGGLLVVEHEGIGNQPAETPIRLNIGLTSLAPSCVAAEADSLVLRYSLNEGESWEEVPVEADLSAEIPGLPEGTLVWYTFEGESDGLSFVSPGSGEIAPHTFYVGDLQEIWCTALDGDDAGFTHELVDGRDQEGADDWQYDRPAGLSGDPTRGFTDNKVWGNDLGYDNYNGAYQPEIVNQLMSPPIALDGARDLVVQYRRWLNIEDGVYDNATVLANGDAVWNNHASSENRGDDHTEDGAWVLHTLRVVSTEDTLSLAWELASDGGLEFGGWNIDDVCVYRAPSGITEEPDNAGDDTAAEDVLPDDYMGTFDEKVVLGTAGCGCDASPGGAGTAVAGIFGALALIRRRRR